MNCSGQKKFWESEPNSHRSSNSSNNKEGDMTIYYPT